MNFSDLVLRHAESSPERAALVFPRGFGAAGNEDEVVTYGELANRIRSFAAGLERAGLKPGDRVCLMFPVSADLYALALALMAGGMATVLIDSGMGTKRILSALKDSKARAIVSVTALLKHRFVIPTLWRMKKFAVDGRGLFMKPLSDLRAEADSSWTAVERRDDDEALITFTTGSTGRPKGADRNHGLLTAQHRALDAHFPSVEGEVDMPCFPVVVLHDLCCGSTAALPPVDLANPAAVEAPRVVEQARELGATTLSGAPAYVSRVAQYVDDADERLPALRRVLVGGAPVTVDLARLLVAAFPQAELHVVYGSTEAEPIASIDMRALLDSEGDGFLVGAPAEVVELALANVPDAIHELGADGIEPYRVADGEIGEVIVRGDHVNRGYVDNPEADRENKLRAADGRIWHRTGDSARLDSQGRIWLVGRVKDVVWRADVAVQPFVVEAAINAVDGVRRSALVAHRGEQEGELAVELETGADLLAVLETIESRLKPMGLAGLPVKVVGTIPVDRRHNSKVDRPALRELLAGLA